MIAVVARKLPITAENTSASVLPERSVGGGLAACMASDFKHWLRGPVGRRPPGEPSVLGSIRIVFGDLDFLSRIVGSCPRRLHVAAGVRAGSAGVAFTPGRREAIRTGVAGARCGGVLPRGRLLRSRIGVRRFAPRAARGWRPRRVLVVLNG